MTSHAEYYHETLPGFILQSELFSLEFIGVTQRGIPSYQMQRRTDWTEVMNAIMLGLLTFPNDVVRAQTFITSEVEDWYHVHKHGRCHGFKIDVQLFDPLTPIMIPSIRTAYNSKPGGSKLVRLGFHDSNATVASFIASKRSFIVESLKELSAKKISSCLAVKHPLISLLPLDVDLRMLVRSFYTDQWGEPYFHQRKSELEENNVERINLLTEFRGVQGKTKMKRKNIVTNRYQRKVSSVKNVDKKQKRNEKCVKCGKRGFKNLKIHQMKSAICRKSDI